MALISRREFFKETGTNAVAGGILAVGLGRSVRANPLGLPIGSQTYPHRARIQQGDFAGLLKDLKAIGVELVELCSPAYKEFAGLADGKTTKKLLDDHGMKCSSAHFTLASLRTDLSRQIQWAQEVGMTQMGTATLSGRVTNGMTTPGVVKQAADEYNKIAADVKRAGLETFLHNEGFENSRLEDGRLTYPVLMEALDPDLVKMQFQMSSMLTIGDPIVYFTNHPGRFVSAHLQGVDVTQGMRPSRAGAPSPKPTAEEIAAAGAARGRGGPGGATGLAVGDDTVDWPKVFAAAKIGGLRNYFIEQAWDLTVKGAGYLKTLKV